MIGLLFSLSAIKAEAAGAMRFDFENSGIKQEMQYCRIDDTWELSCTKKYEYYPDGTIKTVYVEDEDICYEGHYDPHGHLMDPSWTFYTGYVEGIILDSNPTRTYDHEGKLTHFEALCIDFDTAEPYIKRVDYEYDNQNRASRVIISSEYLTDNPIFSEITEGVSAGHIFSYVEEGNYTITHETRYGMETAYRTVFCYDAKCRLVRYDSFSETVNYIDGRLYTDSESYLFYYDENGYLSRRLLYRDGEESPVYHVEYQYRKTDDDTLLCDVFESGWGSNESEISYTTTYVFDKEGRLVESDDGILGKYRYEFSDGPKVNPASKPVLDVVYHDSGSDNSGYCLVLMSDGTVVGSNLESVFPQKSIEEINTWNDLIQIGVCGAGIIGLRRDGSVVAVKNPNDPHHADYEYEDILQYTRGWQRVKKIVMAGNSFYALTDDGRVLVPGTLIEPMFAEYKDWDYTQWSGLEDLIYYGSPQGHGLLGLKQNGRILCTDPLENTSNKSEVYRQFEGYAVDIVAVDSSQFLFTALKKNGTVLAAGSEAYSAAFRDEVRELKDVAQVVAMNSALAVRLSDGTVKVVNCYYEDYMDQDIKAEVSNWKGIRQIYTNRYQLFALTEDGQVLVAGNHATASNINKSQIEKWTDIVEMKVYGDFYGSSYVLAWQTNGTLLTDGFGTFDIPS